MVPVISKVDHQYDSLDRKAGDEYECQPQDVPVLLGLGWVSTREHLEQLPEPRRRATYKRILAS